MSKRRDRERKENREGWGPWLEKLSRTRSRSREMGGPERVERVHAQGKLDVRQRIEELFDPGSFIEIGSLVGNKADVPADGYVCGIGQVEGRPVLVGAEDYTIFAGTSGGGGSSKRYRIAELARQERVPLVLMLEGAGARMGGPATGAPGRTPNDLLALADLCGETPIVCLVMGVSAGHGALKAPLSDFVVMTEDACMFTGGPPLVKAATGEEVSKQDLGGPKVCVEIAGSVHNVAPDDQSAIAMARRYLSYLPSSRHGSPPRRQGPDTAPRRVEELLEIIPPNNRKPYDVREVIEAIADDRDFFEVQPRYGRSLVTALARLGGRPVAFVANNPGHASGALDAAGAIKAAEFLETMGCYGIPVVFLIDNPGVMSGSRAEREGILKWGGAMFLAARRLASPKISVLMRKGFGFGLVTMAHMPFDGQTLSLALPAASIASMPAASGGKAAGLDEEARARIEKRQQSGPYGLGHHLGVDEVIDPRELRNALLGGLSLAAARRQPNS